MKIKTRATALRVRDIMSREIITVPSGTPLDEAAQILANNFISGAPVVDLDGEVIGVVSVADLAFQTARGEEPAPRIEGQSRYFRELWAEDALRDGFSTENHFPSRLVDDVMTAAVFVVDEAAPLAELVKLLLSARIHRAVVKQDDKVVGIVTTMDLIRVIPDLQRAAENACEPW